MTSDFPCPVVLKQTPHPASASGGSYFDFKLNPDLSHRGNPSDFSREFGLGSSPRTSASASQQNARLRPQTSGRLARRVDRAQLVALVPIAALYLSAHGIHQGPGQVDHPPVNDRLIEDYTGPAPERSEDSKERAFHRGPLCSKHAIALVRLSTRISLS